jgi:hypothetical protein
MATQEFANLTAGDPSLLRQVERIVIESHRRWYESRGIVWSEPVAYRWLRYEDPLPVARLADGVEKLLAEGAEVDADAVDKACMEARKRGFSN